LIETRQVRSSSRSGVYHEVTYRDGVPESCGCESFTHRGYCRHVGHRPAEQPGGLQTNSFGLIRIERATPTPTWFGRVAQDLRLLAINTRIAVINTQIVTSRIAWAAQDAGRWLLDARTTMQTPKQ
jgi:hypothetical protein